MDNTALQPALREWRAHMGQPTRAVALLGAAAILALIGPFGTDAPLEPFARAGYWLLLVGLGYSAGFLANVAARALLAPGPRVVQHLVPGWALTTLAIVALVHVLNGLIIGYWAQGRDALSIAVDIAVIAFIVNLVFLVAASDRAAAPDAPPPPLLDRLPFDMRGPLVAVSVEDHYVRIRTTRGEELVLMRLSDAMREVGTTPGLQVHRSHWLALDQVRAARREGDRAILSMVHGAEIPVSRANVPAIREAGLLPR